jgi:hypothetical protein
MFWLGERERIRRHNLVSWVDMNFKLIDDTSAGCFFMGRLPECLVCYQCFGLLEYHERWLFQLIDTVCYSWSMLKHKLRNKGWKLGDGMMYYFLLLTCIDILGHWVHLIGVERIDGSPSTSGLRVKIKVKVWCPKTQIVGLSSIVSHRQSVHP